MKTLACLLICVGTMCAQEKRSEPYRMSSDVMGESVEEFRHNNPKCAFDDFTEGMVKERVKRVGCRPKTEGQEEDSLGQPDTNYDGVPLWTQRAIFKGKDGLVILAFEFRSSDAVRIEEQLLRDVGPPPSRGLIWENGTSSMILQPSIPDTKYGLLILMQDKFYRQMWELAKEKAQQLGSNPVPH